MKDATLAAKRYSLSIAVSMTLYVLGLFSSIYAIKLFELPLLTRYALALLPALPIGYTILAVLKFMRDSDEFVRAQAMDRFIKASGTVLFACTLWGFMENFADAPHVELWWVYPFFWMAYGLFSCLPRRLS